MGVLAAYFVFKGEAAQAWRLFLTTGILCGFTTFSTFPLDATLIYERRQEGMALFYILASVLVSIMALVLGLFPPNAGNIDGVSPLRAIRSGRGSDLCCRRCFL